jgi:CheY-like chemotaxis protein
MMADRVDHLPSLAGVHVLVVEDDWRFADVLATVLRSRGALVTVAPSPAAALGLLRTVVPGVLVVGTRASAGAPAWLAAAARLPHAPAALAITGEREEAGGRPVVPAGFQACLPRPVELGEFCRVVGALAAKGQGSGPIADPAE